MNMIKEGIQTRRRKQKSTNGNPNPKSKHNKQVNISTMSIKDSKPCLSKPTHDYNLTPVHEEYLGRQGNYQYGNLYSQHLHHHPYTQAFEQHQRLSEITTNNFDNELCTREIVTSPLSSAGSSTANNMINGEEQHLNIIKTVNNDRL
jgi:hypothetical protein